MNLKLSYRGFLISGGLICLSILGFAYFLEHQFKLEPCPLCLLQRIVYGVMALVFLLGALQNCRFFGRYIYLSVLASCSLLGLLLSGRHIYLQHLPIEQVPSCTAGFEKLLAYHPLLDALKMIFYASGECAKVDLLIFGLSLSEWTLIGFLMFFIFCILLFYWIKKRRI